MSQLDAWADKANNVGHCWCRCYAMCILDASCWYEMGWQEGDMKAYLMASRDNIYTGACF